MKHNYNETEMRKDFCKAIKRFHPVKIENVVGVGTPDVNSAVGEMELKYKKEWPKRSTTKLRINHFTALQRAFAIERTLAGGQTFFVLLVGRDADGFWLIFDGAWAAENIGEMTKSQLIDNCLIGFSNTTRKERQAILINFFKHYVPIRKVQKTKIQAPASSSYPCI